MDPSDFFTCKNCGECCRGYGGTFVTQDEIRAIASYVGVEAGAFVRRYCQASGERPVLAQGDNGYCIFWDGLCSIHALKPRMCRNWPFIEGVIRDPINWEIMAGQCPGIRADAPYVEVAKHIRRILRVETEESLVTCS